MSTEVEEKVAALMSEVERLRGKLATREKASDDAANWRRKIIALSEHHRRLVRQLSEMSDRLGRERAELERECRSLQREVAELRVEKRTLFERWSRLQTQSLSRFLGSALEKPPDPEWVRRLQVSSRREQALLGLITSNSRS